MMFSKDSFDKMPVGLKTIIGFALFAGGAYQILFAGDWAGGDIRFFYAFVAIGVMYIVNGLPSMIDGVMTMFSDKKE
jgi:hypothetical protein